jgi:DNA-binding YbaB/EbfC family protein
VKKKPMLPPEMFEQLHFLRQQLHNAQAELAGETVRGIAGGGAVMVSLTGDLRCTEVFIDPDLLKEADGEKLREMVMTAVNMALEESRNLTEDHLSSLSPD